MQTISLQEDMHVHSTFSDGKNTIAENLAEAHRKQLTRVGCVDHVRRDTTWVEAFVQAVRTQGQQAGVHALACVEAKILNAAGDLDMPSIEMMDGVDYIYAADHQFPLGDACYSPQQVREMLAGGSDARECVAQLVLATVRVMQRNERVVLAHLFSVLPKVGLDESMVTDEQLESLTTTARDTSTIVEVDERWRCPSLRTTAAFLRAGVTVVASSDSHRAERIGEFSYLGDLTAALAKL